MEIRKATPADLPILLELYAHARAFMAAHGNPNQWKTTEPSEERICRDVEMGCLYVCCAEGRVVGSFYYSEGPDATYQKITGGSWLDDQPYGVVHRIASDGTQKGTGAFCLRWAFERCKNLRIDTHQDNYVMQNLLKKEGFVHCGTIFVADGSPRLAYQKKAE